MFVAWLQLIGKGRLGVGRALCAPRLEPPMATNFGNLLLRPRSLAELYAFWARVKPCVVRDAMRPSGEAPSQPCTSSSRSTRKRHGSTEQPSSF